jgi:hypothetical protein
MNGRSARSQLHLQMGQEVIYVLMALGLMAALVLAFTVFSEHDCSVPANANKSECSPSRPAQPPAPPPSPPKRPLPEKPPILNLTERGGFYFDSGSIKLRSDFEAKLREEVIPEIVKLSAVYRATVIEVIGYTDGVPLRGAPSSMDQRLLGFLNGSSDETAPVAADNVGLGMGRAVAVVRALREDPQLRNLMMLPLSAGQTTGPDDQPIAEQKFPATSDEQRRRIEIRLRRRFND